MVHALCGFMLVVWLLSFGAHAQAQTLAFPSAEGFGRFAQGGRGGRVIQVTNLNASGPGSFRACLEATGPRTCIFRVGGVIDWPTEYPTIPPYLTIAGQTAPGDGVVLKNFQLAMFGGGGAGSGTHDVIVRHIRIRPGQNARPGGSFGATEDYYSHDIIYDHVSFSWASDDSTGGVESTNVTYQWVLGTEGLNDAPDNPGQPSKCMIWYGRSGQYPTTNVSVLHSFWANHSYRCPAVANGNVQMVNNVLYNIGLWSHTDGGYTGFPLNIEFVNNYYHTGPNTDIASHGTWIRATGCGATSGGDCQQVLDSRMYLSGNYHNLYRPDNSYPEDNGVTKPGDPPLPIVGTPLSMPTIPSLVSAQQARIDVVAKAGSTMPRRDAVDQSAVNDITNGTGRFPRTENESAVGGYPVYNSGTPYTDTDSDGMSDEWEVAHGLNPNDPSDGPRMAANGYTNLENFLNELAGDNVFGTTILPAPTRLRVTSQSQ